MAGMWQRRELITSDHTREIMSYFGMRGIGNQCARIATTGRQQRKMAGLGTSRARRCAAIAEWMECQEMRGIGGIDGEKVSGKRNKIY